MNITSKLPNLGTTIFTVMSALAREHNAINLSQGFPNYSSDQRLIELVYQHMLAGHNQYAPMPGVPALREQIAIKVERNFGRQMDVEQEITITTGASQAIFTTISAFVQAGDEVILIEPAFDIYRPAVELNGGIPVVYQLHAPDYSIDWTALGALISERTRMLIINTPHNPTGTILRAEDLQAVEQLLRDTNILLLSDEVYEHLIYDGVPHESALRYPGLNERTIACFSFGKTFHNTGWKVGYCIAPPALTKEIRKLHQYTVFSVNTPVQHALADFLKDPQTYESLPAFYQQKRDLLASALQGSRLKPLPCSGTYFQLFDYRAVSDEKDTDFAVRLTKELGVATIPVSVFNGSGLDEKVIRICFAKTEDMLKAAGERLISL